MKATRYFLPVILLTFLSTDVFAQDPSPKDALDAYCGKKGCQDEYSDVKVGKQLEVSGRKYWPVRAKRTYRKRKSDGEIGSVHDVEWNLFEDGFGGYKVIY